MGASKKIRLALLDKELTQNQFATIAGIPFQTLKNRLSRDTWKYADVERIADLLNCDVVFQDRETKKIY